MSTSYKYFISNDHPFKAKRGVVGRGVITPFFIKTSPYNCLPLTFSNFVHPPAPLPVASNPQPHCCLVSLAECVTVPHKLICHFTSSLCLLFFIKFLFFHQMMALEKLQMFFISSKKFFSFLRYSNFCNFFPSFPSFQIQNGKQKCNRSVFMMS